MVILKESMMTNNTSNDVELRKLPALHNFQLSQLLEFEDGWKALLGVVTIECKEGNPLKYTHQHVQMIETAGRCQQRPFSEIFLEEWGTSGKHRPTLSILLKFLRKAELYRVADFVAVELLNEPPPTRPDNGPAAQVEYPSVVYRPPPSAPPADFSQTFDKPSAPPLSSTTELLSPARVVNFPYDLLEKLTWGFREAQLLGSGAGSSVYLAQHHELKALAIKKLHESEYTESSRLHPAQQFVNEVEVLAQLSHPNLLPLVGYSHDGPALCIVYEFMKNGSLLDRLARKDDTQTLPWRLRMEIALGTARGLSHLHSQSPDAIVHRDVKSANILLDGDFNAKLGDFGLARPGSRGNTTKSVGQTKAYAGTQAYMAPEAHRGDVSVKLDIYSFGVVLLELLTGLPPYDEKRDGHDLITFVQDATIHESLVDSSAGEWPREVATRTFNLANSCFKKKKERPFIEEVIAHLQTCLS